MTAIAQTLTAPRYSAAPEEKASGATYTPNILADFVASKIFEFFRETPFDQPIRVLDPAVGNGALVVNLVRHLAAIPGINIKVNGFETDKTALDIAAKRLNQNFPNIEADFKPVSFLDFVLQRFGTGGSHSLFSPLLPQPEKYDLIIANPPYVRTQVMGGKQARRLAKQFNLSGRVDVYHAFILAIAQVLKPTGIAGIIVSNRFMTTKSGASVRKALLEKFAIWHVWDMGDTKLFDAAVLPAVLLVAGKTGHTCKSSLFTSICQVSDLAHDESVNDPIAALSHDGVVKIGDGRHFRVQHGKLDTNGTADGVWRLATNRVDSWLERVRAHSWGTFADIGTIRVGVKTCADKVFIANDWEDIPQADWPELLRPLATHHIAHRFKAVASSRPWRILYPHEIAHGRRRAVNLALYPKSQAYLEVRRPVLESRKYVLEAGRNWYEIWVPQNPDAWKLPKLVFRDIAEEPTFWLDLDGSVVNGDCYWLTCHDSKQHDLLWLAVAIGNSSFIERFYDYRFHNKLYAGRRRFITQYVEKFPLPDPYGPQGKAIIAKAKQIYECSPSPETKAMQEQLETAVWQAFGLEAEKVSR